MANRFPTIENSNSMPTKRSTVPRPFVRRIRYHLDSCAGTNKSQYLFGGLGLLIASGLLDTIQVLYMVVGHTKFGLDQVARSIAGKYNVSDTFNHGHLLSHIAPFATGTAYDGHVLETWKRGTEDLFKPVTSIMRFRNFLLVADDGKLNVGTPVPLPDGIEPYPSSGLLYADKEVMRASEELSGRTLRDVVFPNILSGRYAGVGSREQSRLLPKHVSRARCVRLFVRRSAEEHVWLEQKNWMCANARSDTELTAAVNAAISKIEPYTFHPSLRKEPYGSKAKQIREQYSKFVPPQFVPDAFELAPTSSRANNRNLVQSRFQVGDRNVVCATENNNVTKAADGSCGEAVNVGAAFSAGGRQNNVLVQDSAAVTTKQKPRWKERTHAEKLLAILRQAPFNGIIPRRKSDQIEIARRMPIDPATETEWDYRTIKRYAERLKYQLSPGQGGSKLD